MAALVFSDGDEISLASLKEAATAIKADPEKSLAASEENLADVERRIEQHEHNKDTLDDLATKVDKAKAKLRCFKGHVCFSKENVS